MLWVDGYYNYDYPSNPIQYTINSYNNVAFDSRSYDRITFKLKLSQVIDLDGRTQRFFRLELSNYVYKYNPGGKVMMRAAIFIDNDHTIYYQTLSYGTPTFNRRLQDKKVNENSTTSEKEHNSFPLFKIFYILSQLGGLFIF